MEYSERAPTSFEMDANMLAIEYVAQGTVEQDPPNQPMQVAPAGYGPVLDRRQKSRDNSPRGLNPI